MGLFKALFGGGSRDSSTSQGTVIRRDYDPNNINSCIQELRWVRKMAEYRLFNGSSWAIDEWPDAYKRVFINAIDTLLNRRSRLSCIVYGSDYYLGETDSSGRPNGYGVYAYAWKELACEKYYKYQLCDWSHGQCDENGYILSMSSNDANDWFKSQGDEYNSGSRYTIFANKRTYR